MNETGSIQEIFIKQLLQLQYDDANLDYELLNNHTKALSLLANTTNSGISVFDFSKRKIAFYSSNYGQALGYSKEDYSALGQDFFAARIHPDDALKLSLMGVTMLKLFTAFSADEKLNHKLINEYRVLNAKGQYVRLIEQYQMLELDKTGQVWLMLNIADISPDQNETGASKSQLYNFRTGNIVPIELDTKPKIELTKREIEILKLVKEGYLSKEISDKLSISVHTVNTHRQRFLEKTGTSNSMEAVMFASKYGLLD